MPMVPGFRQIIGCTDPNIGESRRMLSCPLDDRVSCRARPQFGTARFYRSKKTKDRDKGHIWGVPMTPSKVAPTVLYLKVSIESWQLSPLATLRPRALSQSNRSL